ncbi:MAG: hypothetical protein AAFN81_12975 [Bacteroidota bacterium]
MRLVSICTTIILLHFSLSAIGQIRPDKGWTLAAGWSEAQLGDQHSSPLLYQSDVLDLDARYTIPGKTYFEVGLRFQIGTIQAKRHRKRTGTLRETPSLFDETESFDYVANPFLSRFGGSLYTRLLWDIGNYSQLGLMAQVRYDLAGIAGDTWQYAMADIGPSYQYHRSIHPKGAVHFAASLPLAAIVMRPNWTFDPSLPDETNYFKGYLRTGTRFTSLHELQHPRISLGYQYQLPKGKTLGVKYQMQWLSYSEPRPLRIFEHGLQLSYSL